MQFGQFRHQEKMVRLRNEWDISVCSQHNASEACMQNQGIVTAAQRALVMWGHALASPYDNARCLYQFDQITVEGQMQKVTHLERGEASPW